MLETKLTFLQKILERGRSACMCEWQRLWRISWRIYEDCGELEEVFGLKLTDSILSEERWGPVMKMKLRQVDRDVRKLKKPRYNRKN